MVLLKAQPGYRKVLPARRPSALRSSKDNCCSECQLLDKPTSTSKHFLETCPHQTDFAPTCEWSLSLEGSTVSFCLPMPKRTLSAFFQKSANRPTKPNGLSTSVRRLALRNAAASVVESDKGSKPRYQRCLTTTRAKASASCAIGSLRCV
jgi:hypothetical protein